MPSLKQKFQQKMALMKATVMAGPQKVGKSNTVSRRLITQLENSDELANMRSSWVDYFEYNSQTKVFTMKTKHANKAGNDTYTWDNVPGDIATKALNGLATCKTSDPTGNNRWWPNKTGSLGAAFWYILKPFHRSAKASRAAEMRDYMYVSGEIDMKPGRPSDKLRQYQQLGRLKFEQQQKARAARGVKI